MSWRSERQRLRASHWGAIVIAQARCVEGLVEGNGKSNSKKNAREMQEKKCKVIGGLRELGKLGRERVLFYNKDMLVIKSNIFSLSNFNILFPILN